MARRYCVIWQSDRSFRDRNRRMQEWKICICGCSRSRERRKYDETVCIRIKRLLKTRSVGILIIAALILSAVLSYLPVTYIQAYKTDKSGTIQVVTGIEAIKAKKADKKALHGEMTEAKIRETIADIKEVLKEYGSLERQNIPLDVYVKKVYSHLDIIAVLEQTIIQMERTCIHWSIQISVKMMRRMYILHTGKMFRI